MDLWEAIGRICLIPQFRNDVYSRIVPNEQRPGRLARLREFLVSAGWRRLSVEDLVQINLYFAASKSDQDVGRVPREPQDSTYAVHRAAYLWKKETDNATPSDMVCSLIGGCVLSSGLAKAYLETAGEEDKIKAQAAIDPTFDFSSTDLAQLSIFFKKLFELYSDASTEEDVLFKLMEEIWILPSGPCPAGSASRNSSNFAVASYPRIAGIGMELESRLNAVPSSSLVPARARADLFNRGLRDSIFEDILKAFGFA